VQVLVQLVLEQVPVLALVLVPEPEPELVPVLV
jgi:hypothetical protein